MSLYADYILERTNDRILEMPSGFATYRYLSEDGVDSVYIIDIYITPEVRKTGQASFLADLIAQEAKDRGCTQMLGTVQPSAKGATKSLQVLLSYGFELKYAVQDAIVMRKDL